MRSALDDLSMVDVPLDMSAQGAACRQDVSVITYLLFKRAAKRGQRKDIEATVGHPARRISARKISIQAAALFRGVEVWAKKRETIESGLVRVNARFFWLWRRCG